MAMQPSSSGNMLQSDGCALLDGRALQASLLLQSRWAISITKILW